ncbi:MAG TPA: hypothetical protein VJM09_11985, partial [Sphingobium sp.]|nr:hypothetical protein [Sphingobium sp.]
LGTRLLHRHPSARVVEAFTDGAMIAAYPIGMYRMRRKLTEVDWIDVAKKYHRVAGLDAGAMGEWRVRRLRPGEFEDEGGD